MFHFHKWSKWQVIHETEVVRPPRYDGKLSSSIIGYAYIQKRTCVKCEFTAYNKQQVNAKD